MPMGLHSFGTTDDGLTVTEVRPGMAPFSAWSWAIAISPATALIEAIWGLSPDAMPTALQEAVSDSMAGSIS